MGKAKQALNYVLGVLAILGSVATFGLMVGFVGFCAGLGWRLALGC